MKKLLALPLLFVIALNGCTPTTTGIEAFKDKSAQDLYVTGEKALKKRSYKVAIQNFEALDALYPFSSYAENSQLHLIYAYHGSNDSPAAVAAADRYIHLYPRSERVDYAYYMKGYMKMQQDKSWVYNTLPMDQSSRDLKSIQEAFQDFSTLIRYFPNSEYAADARKRMIFIRDLIAKHEIDVARFYYKHKAYVAAANRANDVVQHYQGSTQVRPALQLMADSYAKMGRKDLEQETLAVINHNQRQPKKG